MQDDVKRMRWYLEHRLEYHVHRLDDLKAELLPLDGAVPDYEKIREAMETKGKINELRAILEFVDKLHGYTGTM